MKIELLALAALGLSSCVQAQPATRGAAQANLDMPEAKPVAFAPLLKQEHPRLLASRADFDALRGRVQNEPWARDTFARVRARADKMLAQPPSKYEIPDGLRLLATSRRVLERSYALSMAWQLSRDPKYLSRLWAELEAAGSFPDWNPRHFLDVGEMTHAFAIAYDWGYEGWTPEQRAFLKNAIVTHGLTPALHAYRHDPEAKAYGWWTRVHHNWNQVCNGGIGLGALAILDQEPALGEEILRNVVDNLPLAIREYGPDGGWAEGPGYWAYATSYTVAIIAALDSSLGQDFGLSRIQGFSKAGDFPYFTAGPNDLTFNYADSPDKAQRSPDLLWLARRFNRPEWAAFARPEASDEARALLWYQPTGAKPPQPPPDKYFGGVEVATTRSGPGADAFFLGLKGGDNAANHAHLDLGTWVLDGLGERWIFNMGGDDYNLPGYFGGQRWTYYRLRSEGQNTLIFNPSGAPDQEPSAKAKITHFEPGPAQTFAIADLSAAARSIVKHQRGWMLRRAAAGVNAGPQQPQVLVQDEFELKAAGQAWWFAHTMAQVELPDQRTAILTLHGRQLRARILAPETAAWQLMDARPLPSSPQPPKQNQNKGAHKLAIHLENVQAARIAVLFSPVTEKPQPDPELKPLSEWR